MKKNVLQAVSAFVVAGLLLCNTALGFSDSNDYTDHWAKDSIEQMIRENVMNGFSDGSFHPDEKVSKAQFAKMLNQKLTYSEPAAINLNDAKPTDWFYKDMKIAIQAGYLSPDHTGRIHPTEALDRESLAVMIALAAKYPQSASPQNVLKDFADASQIKNPKLVASIVDQDVIAGYPDGTFRPQQYVTRAEAAKILSSVTATGLGWKNVTAIATGTSHAIALLKNGSVIATGSNERGQCNVSGWHDIKAITATSHLSLGLKSDGTVVSTNPDKLEELAGWKHITAISAFDSLVLGLKSDGTVLLAGPDYEGKAQITHVRDIQAVSAGFDSVVALKKDGTVVAFGPNDRGECNVSEWRDIVQIASDFGSTVGLTKDGTVVIAGEGFRGGKTIADWKGITALYITEGMLVGLKKDGTIEYAGYNGRIGYEIQNWSRIASISQGFGDHILGVKTDGTVISSGVSPASVSETYAIKVRVNGAPLDVPTGTAFYKNGVAYAPAELLMKACSVESMQWQQPYLVVRDHGKELKFRSSCNFFYLDGSDIRLSAPTQTRGNVLCIPVSNPVAFLGGKTDWDPATRTLDILSRKALISQRTTLCQQKYQLDGLQHTVLSPSGTLIANTTLTKAVELRSSDTGKLLYTLSGDDYCTRALAFSGDDSQVAGGFEDGTVRIWDTASGALTAILKGHAGKVSLLQFAPDGKTVLTGAQDGTARLWDAKTGQELHRLTSKETLQPDTTLKGWNDLSDGYYQESDVGKGIFSPDGKWIATGAGSWGKTHIWNTATGELVSTIPDAPYAFCFSPDSSRILIGTREQQSTRIWDVLSEKALVSLPQQTDIVTAVEYSADGTKMLTGTWIQSIQVWDAATGKRLCSVEAFPGTPHFSPDGKYFAGSSGKSVRIWSVETGKVLMEFDGHTDTVVTLNFSKDWHRMLTEARDNTTRVWDVPELTQNASTNP